MRDRTEKILNKIIFLGSILILFLPLFIYRGVLYPYVFSKIIVFQILVEIIFVAWLVLMIYKKEYRPNWKNPLVCSLTIFIGVLFLTAITGLDFKRSFWSTQERMTGVLTMLHFYAFFIVLISVFKEWKDWRKLIWASLICSFLVGLYGLGQKIGLGSLIAADSHRLSSLLGNPIYLGSYSFLNIFLSIFLFLKEKNKIIKILSIFLAIFNFLIMSLTDSRGVMIVFVFSFFLFFFFLIFNLSSKKWRRIISFILALVFFIIVLGFIFFQTPRGLKFLDRLPSIFGRIFYLEALLSGSDQRTIPWQIGLEGFLEKPILGWGWENFNIPYNKYYRPEILKWGESATWYDRSHNQVIDIFVLTGVLGGLAYLIMYGSIFWLLFKKRLQKLEYTRMTRTGLFVLGLMFLAYFIQNLTVFDTPALLIMFYFSLGLVYFTTQRDTNLQMHTNDTNEKEKLKIKNYKLKTEKQFLLPILVLLIVIFLPWAMYKFNIEPWQKGSLAFKAVQTSRKNLIAGLNFYKEALAEEDVFTNLEIRTFLAKTISEQEIKNESYKEGLMFVIAEMEKNIKEHPLDVRHWLNLGQIYNLMGLINKEYLDKAELTLNQAKTLSPYRQTIYFELVKNKILAQDFDRAIQIAEQAVNLDSQIAESYKVLSFAWLAAGKIEEGLLYLDKARESVDIYSEVSFSIFISSTYFKFGDIAKAIKIAETSVQKFSRSISAYTNLAALYKEAGEKEKAIETVRKVVELDPSFAQEAEIFIKELEQF